MIKRSSAFFITVLLILLSGSEIYAAPSLVTAERDVVAWSVSGVLIWRFPKDAEKAVRAAAERYDASYAKGFHISDIKVVKRDGKWTLCIGDKALIASEKPYARGAGTDTKMMGTIWMSRIYDAIALTDVHPLGDRHKLKGGHSISSKVSWYGGKFIGRKCANGERFTETHMCAAARGLPFGTLVRVTTPKSNKSVVVRVTDRFAEHRGRALDISQAAAEILGIKRAGVANVLIDVLGTAGRVGGR